MDLRTWGRLVVGFSAVVVASTAGCNVGPDEKLGSVASAQDQTGGGGDKVPSPDDLDRAWCSALFRNPDVQNDINAILAQCPRLATHLVWEDPNGSPVPWSAWKDMRAQLQARYRAYLDSKDGSGAEVKCPAPSTLLVRNGPDLPLRPRLYLPAALAQDVFLAHVAHVFYVERMNLVPWSIVDYRPAELDPLLHAASYHAPIRPSAETVYPAGIAAARDYQLAPRTEAARALDCDPHEGYRFMTGLTSTSGRDLRGVSPLETLKKLTYWARWNVIHGNGSDYTDATFPYQLRDRLRPMRPTWWPSANTIVAPVGCQSTTKLFEDLARSVNIPLLIVGTKLSPAPLLGSGSHYIASTHAGLVYAFASSDPLVLWHMDDVYEGPRFPIRADGTAFASMSDEATTAGLFAATWLPASELSRRGFALSTDFPKMYPGAAPFGSSSGASEDRYDFGRFAGYWRNSSLDPASSAPADAYWSHLPFANHSEIDYQLGGNALLSEYCRDVESTAGFDPSALEELFAREIQRTQWNGLAETELPVVRTTHDYFLRTRAAVTAWGGCSAVASLTATYPTNLGSTVSVP